MFKINNECKPDARYRIIRSSAEAADVAYSTTKALELLENQINKLSEESATFFDRKLIITLIGSVNISTTPIKYGVTKYFVVASQSVLVEISELQ